MSDYSKNTNFTAKDTLASGTPAKKVLGAELDAEFDEISTAVSTKLDNISSLSAATPDHATDYLAMFDASAVADKKALLSAISPMPATTFYCKGGTGSQVIGSSAWTEVTCLDTEVYDVPDANTGGQISFVEPESNGVWLFIGRLSINGAPGSKIRASITSFNSGGTATSRQYSETETTNQEDTVVTFGIYPMSDTSTGYIAMEVFIEGGGTVRDSGLNQFVGFKLF